MDSLFYALDNMVNTSDIIKCWVKELSKFKSTPNHVYKTKSLKKAYQILIIFACQLYGQETMKTFLQSWVVVLEKLANYGRPLNCSGMLAL